jgi:hypothetical protein
MAYAKVTKGIFGFKKNGNFAAVINQYAVIIYFIQIQRTGNFENGKAWP